MSKENTKECFRQRIWDFMEKNDIARFPRPVFHRIPNFKGAEEVCKKVSELPEFQRACVIKIDPDKPLQHIRYLTLVSNKTLLVPTPRLKSGLLNKITPPSIATDQDLHICSTLEGVKRHSVKIGLNKKINIDLVIVGSVAASVTGYRIGKGEGYSDMEFAMMATIGAVNSDTVVITIVHDCQVLTSLPSELFKEYDVPVDIIVTPTRVIYCEPRLKKPDHIIWSLITEEKLNQIPILKILRSLEQEKKTICS